MLINLVKCTIFVPYCCFEHKIEAIKNNGKEFVTIIQEGDDFEEC
jgi:threonine dehydratase